MNDDFERRFRASMDSLRFSGGQKISMAEALETEVSRRENGGYYTMKQRIFKRAAVAALAAALVLALGLTAYASGFAESLILQLRGTSALSDADLELYERAAELSDKDPVTVTLAERVGSAITMEESYYDGENLMLVYSLDALNYPVEFGFGPGDEHFDDLWSAGPDCDFVLPDQMTVEERKEILRELEENGSVGFTVRYVDLSDHILLADGTELGPMAGAEDDGKVLIWPQNGLPEAAQGLDQLDVVFQVKEFVGYYYLDGTQSWCYYPLVEGEPVTFTLRNVG